MKISLTSIYVHDPEEAFDFYTEVLGFQERLHVPEANLAIVASPQEPGGTGLLLEPNENPIARRYQEGLYSSGLPAIVFGVADIRAEHKRLEEQGVKFRQEPTEVEGGIMAVFDDGCGNLIQLFEA